MSFDLLPADLVLKIFNNLPFKDRLRLMSGVNRLFRDISMESVTKMKTLQITDHVVNAAELSPLLASSLLSLKELSLDLCWGTFIDISKFEAGISIWHLPKLTNLYVNLNVPTPSSILRHFPASFPRLETCNLRMIKEIDDQAILALSQLMYLQELRLPDLETTKEMFRKMIIAIPSIRDLEIKKSTIDGSALQALSKLKHLRELYFFYTDMTESELIKLIANVPSLEILTLWTISDVESPDALVDFLTLPACRFHRNLEIRLNFMYIKFKLEQMAILDEVANSGGPVVDMDTGSWQIRSIRYCPTDY